MTGDLVIYKFDSWKFYEWDNMKLDKIPSHIGVKIHRCEFTFNNITDKAYVSDFEAENIQWHKYNYKIKDFYSLLKIYKSQNEEMYNFIFEENVEYLI